MIYAYAYAYRNLSGSTRDRSALAYLLLKSLSASRFSHLADTKKQQSTVGSAFIAVYKGFHAKKRRIRKQILDFSKIFASLMIAPLYVPRRSFAARL